MTLPLIYQFHLLSAKWLKSECILVYNQLQWYFPRHKKTDILKRNGVLPCFTEYPSLLQMVSLVGAIVHKVLLPVFPRRDSVYRLKRPGKMQLVGVVHHSADLVDGQLALFQQLGRLGHAVMHQELLRRLPHPLFEYFPKIIPAQPAHCGNLFYGDIRLIVLLDERQGLLDIKIPKTLGTAGILMGRGFDQLIQKQEIIPDHAQRASLGVGRPGAA